MHIHEIYILNMAIGGGQIPMLPALGHTPPPRMLVNGVKQRMVQAGYLENEHTLSPKGLAMARHIQAYKQATYYVKLNSVVLALPRESEDCVLMRPDYPHKNAYRFVAADRAGLDLLWQSYPFLAETGGEVPGEEIVPYEDLCRRFTLRTGNCLWLSTYSREEGSGQPELLFSADGALYHYDQKSGLLCGISHSELREIWNQRLGVAQHG